MITNYPKLNKFVLIGLFLGFLSSCGYFSDDPVEGGDTFFSDSLSGGCRIDVDELVLILEKDIQSQISCLEDNLVKFSKYVRSTDKTSVSAPELSSFVHRFFEGHASLIVDSIGLIFDINRLFLQDSDGSISNENIAPLFKLLRVANVRLSKMISTIRNFQEEKLDKLTSKHLIESELMAFSTEITEIIKSRGGSGVNSLELGEFIGKVKDQFSTININDSTFNVILSMKKLLLGGEENILTRDQLFVLLERLPRLGGLAFNILTKDPRSVSDKLGYFRDLRESVEVLESTFFEHKREEIIFKEGQLRDLVASVFVDDSELYMDIVEKVKTEILNTNLNSGFSYRDIRNVSNLTKVFLDGLIFMDSIKSYSDDNNSLSSGRWELQKKDFLKSFDYFTESLSTNFNENIYFPQEMKVFSFISFISEKFDSIKVDSKILDLGMVAKLALVGGKKESFSKLELLILLEKSKSLGPSVFDLLYSNDGNHSPQEMTGVYYRAIKSIRPLVTNQKYLHLITLDEVVSLASKLMNNEDVLDYLVTVEKVKEKVLGGYSGSLSVDDINKLLIIGENFFGRLYFLDLAYDLYKEELSSTEKITYLNYKHHPKFSEFERDQILEYRKEFIDIVKNFKLYRFDDGSQFYGKEIKRSKGGLLELFSIRFLYNTIAQYYGHKETHNSLFALSLDELNELLFAFEPVLKDFGLWSKYPETFARNALLLADLFQGNSDGNMNMNGNEAAEYGSLALFAIKTAGQMIDEIKKSCSEITAKGETGFALNCYRPLFFDTLLNKLELAEKLPKLNQYLSTISKEVKDNFLISIEGFARDDQDPDRPETKRDLVLLIGALLNIESTFLRYDINNSNVLEPEELNKAFPVYEQAIISIAKLEEGKRDYAKSIFLYMIKNMKIPNQLQVFNFHYNPLVKKKISSERLNIGALLYNMVVGMGGKK